MVTAHAADYGCALVDGHTVSYVTFMAMNPIPG